MHWNLLIDIIDIDACDFDSTNAVKIADLISYFSWRLSDKKLLLIVACWTMDPGQEDRIHSLFVRTNREKRSAKPDQFSGYQREREREREIECLVDQREEDEEDKKRWSRMKKILSWNTIGEKFIKNYQEDEVWRERWIDKLSRCEGIVVCIAWN